MYRFESACTPRKMYLRSSQPYDDGAQDLGLVLQRDDNSKWILPEDSMACWGLTDSDCGDLQFKPKVRDLDGAFGACWSLSRLSSDTRDLFF